MFSAGLCESPYRDQRPTERLARLTARETQIVKLVADGKTYREIAHILGLSVKTAALRPAGCILPGFHT